MLNNRWLRDFVQGIIFLIFMVGYSFGQNYDPYTGELIVTKADTTEKQTSELSQQFDPLTGEPISPQRKIPQVQDVGSDITAENPRTIVDSPLLTMEEICDRAKTDAFKNTSNLWFLGGFVYFIGPPIYLFSPPQPPIELLMTVQKEQMLAYSECYTKEAKQLRAKRMLTGCGLYIALVFTFAS